MFKRKTWTEVSRCFTPPNERADKLKAWGADHQDLLMKILYGFTTVELRCDQTGEVKFIQSYGNQTKKENKNV